MMESIHKALSEMEASGGYLPTAPGCEGFETPNMTDGSRAKLIKALRVAVEYIEADMDSGDPVIRFTANASLLHISSILSETPQ